MKSTCRALVLDALQLIAAQEWREVVQPGRSLSNAHCALELAGWVALERLAWREGHHKRADARFCAEAIGRVTSRLGNLEADFVNGLRKAIERSEYQSEHARRITEWRKNWTALLPALRSGGAPESVLYGCLEQIHARDVW